MEANTNVSVIVIAVGVVALRIGCRLIFGF